MDTSAKTEEGEMPPEQAADFAALQAAARVGAVEEGQAQGQVEEVKIDLATEIKSLTLAFVAMAAPILPSLKRIYTEETTEQAAAAVAAVCEKHGWAPGGLMGEWGVEIGAAVVLLPLAFATVQGVKTDIANNKEAERKPATVPQVEVVQKAAPVESATFGEVVPAGAPANA